MKGFGFLAGAMAAAVAAVPFAFLGVVLGLVYDEDVPGRDSAIAALLPFGIAYLLGGVASALAVVGAIQMWRR